MYEVAFIVTKPLQLLFAVGIIRQLDVAERSCIIITYGFRDALAVCERFSSTDWDLSAIDVRICADRSKAELFAIKRGATQVFVDSDVGLQRFLLLLRKQLRGLRPEIWVYEESWGTYITDLYKGPLKRLLFEAPGVGTKFGGCRVTSGIVVPDPDFFRVQFPKHMGEVQKIECSPSEFIEHDLEEWRRIFEHRSVTTCSAEACSIFPTD